jgi:hypothetical protein
VSRSAHDLSLLLDDGALDLRSLAHVVHLWNKPGGPSLAIETLSTYVKHHDLIAEHGSVVRAGRPVYCLSGACCGSASGSAEGGVTTQMGVCSRRRSARGVGQRRQGPRGWSLLRRRCCAKDSALDWVGPAARAARSCCAASPRCWAW